MQSLKVLSGQNPREIAVEVLGRRTGGDYVEELLEGALAQKHLLPKDRSLCQELVYGIIRNQSALDHLIVRKTQNRVQKPRLQDILRLGLYQIFWLDRIPGHAAVHETVELAKRRGFGPQAGFVNAVLRGYLREGNETRALLEELRHSTPWIGYSHPEWLVKRWLNRFGSSNTVNLLARNNLPPDTFARVNTLKTNAEHLLPMWRDEGVDYDFVRRDWLEENLVFKLKSHPPLDSLRSFQQGFFYIQDPSTLLAASELAAKPGEQVLDVCAAPGGKLSYIAAMMDNQGRILATDISENRLNLVKENCARLGITCVETALAGQTTRPKGVFDRAIIDAPCSNTGVMGRRVELRWRIREEELTRLRAQQTGLLKATAAELKKGGTLVYSTCSIEPEENQLVIRDFLEQTTGWRLVRERELLPFIENTDGAYCATLTMDGHPQDAPA
jgi:16S rRNA (cytosine967-C5)-methyltransferase